MGLDHEDSFCTSSNLFCQDCSCLTLKAIFFSIIVTDFGSFTKFLPDFSRYPFLWGILTCASPKPSHRRCSCGSAPNDHSSISSSKGTSHLAFLPYDWISTSAWCETQNNLTFLNPDLRVIFAFSILCWFHTKRGHWPKPHRRSKNHRGWR